PPRDHATGSAQRAVGFVTIGAGAIGLGLGIATGIIAIRQKSELTDKCGPQLACGPSNYDAADTYNGTRVISTVGFIAGGALAAAGLVIVLTAPRGQRVALTFSPGHAALRGAF